ncbi:MAG: hypothetical protein AB2787_03655 [Candidatus Thiodiazotropha endolucinida]
MFRSGSWIGGNQLLHLGILKPDTWVKVLNVVGIPTAIVYFTCMFVFPFIDGQGDWDYVQNVWDRWQSINVGMLAFISSITAFNISKYNENKQRERNFLAAKAFLPTALSELCSYFKSCARILTSAWEGDSNRSRPVYTIPTLPDNYREVFSQSIRYAETDVGNYLTRILVWLQVYDSRLINFIHLNDESEWKNADKRNIIIYLCRLAELQVLVNKLFQFARNMEYFDSTDLKWEDFNTAFKELNIDHQIYRIDEEVNLETITRKVIDVGINTEIQPRATVDARYSSQQ